MFLALERDSAVTGTGVCAESNSGIMSVELRTGKKAIQMQHLQKPSGQNTGQNIDLTILNERV